MVSPPARLAITAALTTRVALLAIGLLAAMYIGRPPGVERGEMTEIEALPSHWDASWYLGIAAGGYRWTPEDPAARVAYFPGFPLALRAVGTAFQLPDREPPWLWAGVALSTLFFAVGLYYLYRLAPTVLPGASPAAAVWLIACYPFSFFYGQVYSESLFIAAVAGAWWFARSDRPLPAAAWGFVAGLTRPVGFVTAILIAGVVAGRVRERRRLSMLDAAMVLSPVLGLAVFCGYMKWLTGDALAWAHAQSHWRGVMAPFAWVAQLGRDIADNGPTGFVKARPYDALNALGLLFAIVTAVPVARRIGWAAALFCVGVIVLPLGTGSLMSMGRYSSVLLPAFIWLASLKGTGVTAAICAVLELGLATLFFTDRPLF